MKLEDRPVDEQVEHMVAQAAKTKQVSLVTMQRKDHPYFHNSDPEDSFEDFTDFAEYWEQIFREDEESRGASAKRVW